MANKCESVLLLLIRYAIMIQAINGMGTKSEFAIDNFSLSPQCFGLGVPPELLEGWHANMTDLELCKYYGKSRVSVQGDQPSLGTLQINIWKLKIHFGLSNPIEPDSYELYIICIVPNLDGHPVGLYTRLFSYLTATVVFLSREPTFSSFYVGNQQAFFFC